jgi:hypothetical protein
LDAGIVLGSVLQLSISGTYKDVFQNELKSMWDGSKMYEIMGAMQREKQLKAAIAAKGAANKRTAARLVKSLLLACLSQ